MTGGNTDRVLVSPVVCAASILLALSRPLFNASMRPSQPVDADSPQLRAWSQLRECASFFLDRDSLRITDADRRDLNAALRAAHDLHHDVPLTGAICTESCTCEVSRLIGELRRVMREGEMAEVTA